MDRICNFLKCSEQDINSTFTMVDISTDLLLKWSKLLEYDLFRLYTQHIILYAPPSKNYSPVKNRKNSLPQFRKNIYTTEIIHFILSLINDHIKTKQQIMTEYNIPKTTLYKWLKKYNIEKNEK